jgi:hypothetical protein
MSTRLLIAVLIPGLLSITEFTSGQEIKSDSKTVHVIYKPENYTITKIDTTLNDSIKLIVNHFTLMDTYAVDYGDVTPDSIEYRYRDYTIEIHLSLNGNEIINKKLVKADFTSDPRYWKNLILFKVWLESNNSQLNKLILRVGLGLPDLYTPVISTLTLGYDGKIEIKLR